MNSFFTFLFYLYVMSFFLLRNRRFEPRYGYTYWFINVLSLSNFWIFCWCFHVAESILLSIAQIVLRQENVLVEVMNKTISFVYLSISISVFTDLEI